jgi:hypothetical protein
MVKLNPKELHLAKCRAAEKWNEVERRKASSQQPVVVGRPHSASTASSATVLVLCRHDFCMDTGVRGGELSAAGASERNVPDEISE